LFPFALRTRDWILRLVKLVVMLDASHSRVVINSCPPPVETVASQIDHALTLH